ncbi:hypothetical protein X975_07139, partial [Stegodyphus mimosarum]
MWNNFTLGDHKIFLGFIFYSDFQRLQESSDFFSPNERSFIVVGNL